MKRLFSLIFLFFSFSFFTIFATNSEQRPKVSIVIPVYKVEPWIRECLDNLVNQTLKEIEIICVDDGSPDNSGAILDEYAQKDSRFKIIHQKNSGVQRARNAGLDVATGEYIALLDSDDYVDIHTYETAYNLAKKDNVDILNFKARIFDDGKDDHINNIDFSDGPVVSAEEYIQNNYRCWVWDNLFKNEIIQKDKIRFIPGIKPADDTCFTYMALGRAKRVKSIPATFYNYRIMPGTLSRMTNEDIFINSYKMFKYICDSWRSGNCLENNEHNLITLIVRWARCWGSVHLRYAQEILDSFGSDVYNSQNVSKCPEYIQKELKRLEYSAESNKNPPLQSGIYRIATASSGYYKRLDISGASKEIGANLQQWETNCTIAQDFEIIRHDAGYYTIKAVCSGKVLDVENGGQKAGTNIHQWDSNDTQAQHWYIIPCEDGSFNIISECNLLAMDVSGNSNNNGANIHCWDINNSNAQKFKFIKADSNYSLNKEPISIAMASDSNYIYPTIVSMTSILENKNSDTKIDFYIMLSGDFEQGLKGTILHLKEKYSDCTITLIDMKNRMSSLYTDDHLTSAAYYRLLLPELLPGIDKVLYLDTDVIVQSDLTKLFDYNIENLYLAGVLETEVTGIDGINYKASVHQKDFYMQKYGEQEYIRSYVNSGILLFNLKNMRNDDFVSKLQACAESHNFINHDQDVLNIVCHGKILPIPNIYNRATWLNPPSNQIIMHYCCRNAKPWTNNFASKSDLWWQYAEKTDCFKEIQEKYLIKDGIYIIASALNDNKVLDIDNASNKDCTNLQLWDKNYTDAQKFNIKYVGDRCSQITAKCSNKSIDVSGAGKNIGTNVYQYTPNNTDAQKWYIIPCGNGYYTIVSKCNMLNLDVTGAKTQNGTNIHCWSSNGTNAQKFKFNRVS